MLAIRMQRLGRKGHAQYRVVVQDARRTPTSGRVVAKLGHYNPHTKETAINKELAAHYLKNGAQPSDRVAKLLTKEGVALPDWVKTDASTTKRATKNPEKLRKNQPAEQEEPAPAEDTANPSDELSEDSPKESDQPSEEPASE